MSEEIMNSTTEDSPLINTEVLAAELGGTHENATEQSNRGQSAPSSSDPFAVVNRMSDWRNMFTNIVETLSFVWEALEKRNYEQPAAAAVFGIYQTLARLGDDLQEIIEEESADIKARLYGDVENDLEPLRPGSLSPIVSMEDWTARHCGNVALFERVCSDLWDHLPGEGPLTDAVFALRESFTEQAEELKSLVNGRGPVQ